MTKFLNMLRDDSGASAAEYALILAIVGAAIAIAAVALGSSIAGSMTRAKDCIDDPGGAKCPAEAPAPAPDPA